MAKLEYSVDAKNVLAKFFRVDKILYVEGDDDVPFWEFMFEKFDAPEVEVRQVGGKNEIQKYIDQITSGKLNAIVATDSDFRPFDGTSLNHDLVIVTAGHSIENTLISAKVLMKVARKTGRLPAKTVTIDECQNWLDVFFERCSALLINDLLDQCEGAKLGVIGDNCDRFFETKQSDRVCSCKIEQYLKNHGLEVDAKLSATIEKIMADTSLSLHDFIRGHFLVSAAHRFITLLVKRSRTKFSISNEAFFGAINLAFEASFDDDHPHYSHYSREFERLLAATGYHISLSRLKECGIQREAPGASGDNFMR
jgi:hypothetical protein